MHKYSSELFFIKFLVNFRRLNAAFRFPKYVNIDLILYHATFCEQKNRY